ncbi:MAG: CDF family Co(II)/Ni(II) efflux transporter DmeF [Bdellovibrionales bacterium]|nr:CDF family Co(II)/Ni(II) efflux transporter DmeF [Bdellovibrionales bacterium]
MHTKELQYWKHHHSFGTDIKTSGERRTKCVIAVTFVMMVIEIVAGTVFGSMALLADGWHMGTHAAALSITVFAYIFARRHASNPRFSFGTGKVGALGGFASAIGLGIVALFVFGESITRLASPTIIRFDEAILVAIVGLLVNLTSAFILRDHHDHHVASEHHHDHNLRAAYLHVLADALTSLFAIFALVVGKYLGWVWMDPVMGLVGSMVIAHWSYGLIKDTSSVLLDAEVGKNKRESIREKIEGKNDDRISDLHIWRVGPKHLAAIVSVVTHEPKDADYYKTLLSDHSDLVHLTVEINRCPGGPH